MRPVELARFDLQPVIVQLPDDTLMGLFLRYAGGSQEVTARTSTDNGQTWSEEASLLTLPKASGAWAMPEAFVDRQGEIHLFPLDCREAQGRIDIWHLRSTNGRKEWQAPKCIWQGYTGALNSVIQLRSGRILLPFSFMVSRSWGNRGTGPGAFTFMGHFDATLVYSDDNGDTWHLAPADLKVAAPDIVSGESGAVEPVALELSDGRVWMLIRTQRGRLYESFSKEGLSWSKPRPSRFLSSESPAGIVRLKDGRIVLFWNGCQRFPYAYGGRHVLQAAISEDEGKTWRGYREVARDPRRNEPPPPNGDFGTAYPFPSLAQEGKVLFITGQGAGRVLCKLLDPEWLLETHQKEDFSEGLEEWSVFGTKGVELATHPDRKGVQVLSMKKTEGDWPSGAVWNFPLGARGRLRLRLRLNQGFGGARLGLTDHFSVPFDEEDHLFNLFNLDIVGGDREAKGIEVPTGLWHSLELNWDCRKRQCVVLLDGRRAVVLPQLRESEGACYLRLLSTAEEVDDAGLLVESVEVDVSDSYPRGKRKSSGGKK